MDRKYKILIVDDEPVNIKMVTEALGKKYTFIGATSGKDALECAQAEDKPDLILLDVMLPDIDGYQILKALKTNAKTYDIPVIFTTGSDKCSDEAEGLFQGAADYITKPFSMNALEARVRTQLELKRYREQLEQQVFEQNERVIKLNKRLREENAQKRRLEEQLRIQSAQLRQAQKLESIGILTAGIVHDFNNILYSILGYSELAIKELPQTDARFEYLEQILSGTKRATGLIKQILSFSRKTSTDRMAIQIRPVVKETLKLLRGALPSTIDIQETLDPKSGYILTDATQIQQVLMNLCTNAYHAMRENGGVLEVRLEPVELILASPATTPDVDAPLRISLSGFKAPLKGAVLKPGAYLRLTVRDTGHGMNADTLSKIFEPFFTTKPEGEGTGLGLSTVLDIVRSHNGAIAVESEIGKGSRFDVFFPTYEYSDALSSSEKGNSVRILRGNEHLMIVEDEESLARMLKLELENFGYVVSAFTNSSESLEFFRRDSSRIDLVITDQTMPALTGVQLAKEIYQIRPDTPVILCTGYNEFVMDEEITSPNIRELMKKPILSDTLAATIRRIIDRKV